MKRNPALSQAVRSYNSAVTRAKKKGINTSAEKISISDYDTFFYSKKEMEKEIKRLKAAANFKALENVVYKGVEMPRYIKENYIKSRKNLKSRAKYAINALNKELAESDTPEAAMEIINRRTRAQAFYNRKDHPVTSKGFRYAAIAYDREKFIFDIEEWEFYKEKYIMALYSTLYSIPENDLNILISKISQMSTQNFYNLMKQHPELNANYIYKTDEQFDLFNKLMFLIGD